MAKKRKKQDKSPAQTSESSSTAQVAPVVAIFDPDFRTDLIWWARTQPAVFDRILNLIEAILVDPFTGIGKPERMKHLKGNMWARRITQEHRLLYLIQDDCIYFLQARLHYQ